MLATAFSLLLSAALKSCGVSTENRKDRTVALNTARLGVTAIGGSSIVGGALRARFPARPDGLFTARFMLRKVSVVVSFVDTWRQSRETENIKKKGERLINIISRRSAHDSAALPTKVVGGRADQPFIEITWRG